MKIRDLLIDQILIAVVVSVVITLPHETTNSESPDIELGLFSARFATGLLALYSLLARWASRWCGITGKHFAIYALLFLFALAAALVVGRMLT